MIVSMTGFGTATRSDEGVSVSVELKTVNNRFFKVALRMNEGYGPLEQRVESLIRESLDRGTVNVAIRIRRERKATDCKISNIVLKSYFEQLLELGTELQPSGKLPLPALDRLVQLPGVIETETERSDEETERIWKLVESTIRDAVRSLQEMRKAEGKSMGIDLKNNIETLRLLVGNVERLAPKVAEQYRGRLLERIGKFMSEQGLTLNETDLVREVALFADRCDVSEETVRFRSHLQQFEAAIDSKEPCGKKLDFLTQELFRETNTAGSKANDAEITKNVVEMKTVIERIREMVQNIE